MRARYPDLDGYLDRDGVKLFYEVYGQGEPTVLLLPTWSIVHSRHWKMQVPYLARHFRVVTFDGRGNGRSDRPPTADAYTDQEFVADALAVMDATETASAVVAGISNGGRWTLRLAAEHPERVLGVVVMGPMIELGEGFPWSLLSDLFDSRFDEYEWWTKFNRHHWGQDYPDFVRFFFSQVFTEPHSTKQLEDAVGWALETDAATLVRTAEAYLAEPTLNDQRAAQRLAEAVACPVLVIQGDEDGIVPPGRGIGVAAATGGSLAVLGGSGHLPQARDPVKVNLLIRGFIDVIHPPKSQPIHWARGRRRRKRALYLSSPIGLGHARRDVAIADALRSLHPDLEIDWLAQHPVTRVLQERGERVHPASLQLSAEVEHIDSESAEHDLHCFQAWRRMDEILLANFMAFHDLVREEDYDLWIGDEAWELDYYLHENPEQKRAAYVWLTDFVGWLPMPDGGEHEASLTADYNAEMIEHIARFPRIRDRAIFVGSPEDIVPDSFGPGLPEIREWTEEHYDFSGDYITGFDPARFSDRAALREELGYLPEEKVCIVTVGGSGVGGPLLRRIIAAYPEAKRLVPELRMVVVAGPRIDPDSLPSHEGMQVRAYVPELYRHLAACDVAVVQGGLTTTMELTANRRPFLYFPLRHHFEQNFHVRYRLERYGAGKCMDFDRSTPDVIAQAVAEAILTEVSYRAVESGGADRAAKRIAELI